MNHVAEGGAIDDPAPGPPGQTVGGFDRAARTWLLTLFGVGGTTLGLVLPPLSRWAADLPWIPFQGPLRLLGSLHQPWTVWAGPAVGLTAALALATWIILNTPVLHIDHDQIRVQRHGEVVRVIERAKVDAVYRHRSRLIIESGAGRRLFEDEIEVDRTTLRDAFLANGYPWEGPPSSSGSG